MTKIHCPNCDHENEVGSEIKTFTHSLSPGLVKVLMKIVKNAGEGRVAQIKCDNGILQGSEMGNYSKLQYWGFIKRTEDAGLWEVRAKAILFLKGDIEVPRKVTTAKTNVVMFSQETIHVGDFRGLDAAYW